MSYVAALTENFQDELEDRLIQGKNECLEGQQQAMAEECFIALTGLGEGFGDEKLVVAQASQEEEQMLEGVFLKS